MIAYIRVSQVGDRDVESARYQTENIQLDEIERWANGRGVELVSGRQFVDRDESGAKKQRPGFDAAMEEVRDGRADGIVVATLDRFSRQSTIDALKRIEEVLDAGGTIASVGGEIPVDPTTPAGEFQLTLFVALNRMNWREYDRRWKVAKRRAADRGVQIARAPLGYRHAADGTLEPGDLAPAIREAFRLAATDGHRAALAYLREADTSGPERRWTMQNLRRTLERRIYLGESTWNGGSTVPDTHTPLTDLATWTRAQSRPRWARSPAADYPLSGGPCRCGTCGSAMVGALSGGGGRRGYRCAVGGGRRHAPACEAKAWIGADRLEQYVLELLVGEAEAREMAPADHPEVVPERPSAADTSAAEAELVSAQLRRDEFAAADLDVSPEAWAARSRALDDAWVSAEVAYSEALADATPGPVTPRSEQVAADGIKGLARNLSLLGLLVKVAPGRAGLGERVSLVTPEAS